jgi:hypothetical protein
MSSIKEIEKAIQQLPREEFFHLRDWMHYQFEDQWDKQLEEDAKIGRLDFLAEEAIAEFRAGKTQEFPANEWPCNKEILGYVPQASS